MFSINERLMINEVAQEELQLILLEYFSRSFQIGQNKFGFGHKDGTAALIVHARKDGSVIKIERGPASAECEIDDLTERIQPILMKNAITAIGHKIMFADLPLKGYYRYRDQFQILPAPKQAPSPQRGFGGHPFQIEVVFSGTSNLSVNHSRAFLATDEISLLCSTLLCPAVYSAANKLNFHWVMQHQDGDVTYDYCQEGYGWNKDQAEGSQELSTVEGIPAAAVVATQDYYTTNSTSIGATLSLPDNLTHSLDIFFSLLESDRHKYLTACYWFQQSIKISSVSASASYVALVTAVEALICEPEASKCEKCSKPTGHGLTKLFIDFIERNVPDASATATTRRELYDLRSKITHGKRIMASDRSSWMPTLKLSMDFRSQRTLYSTVRIALVNWLLSRERVV